MKNFLRILASISSIILLCSNSGCTKEDLNDPEKVSSFISSVKENIAETTATSQISVPKATKNKEKTTAVPTEPTETSAKIIPKTTKATKKSPETVVTIVPETTTKAPETTPVVPKETSIKITETKPKSPETKPKDQETTPGETQAYKIPKTGPRVDITANVGSIHVGEMTKDVSPVKVYKAEDYVIKKVVIHKGYFIDRYQKMKKDIKIKIIEIKDTEFRIETNMSGIFYYTVYLTNPAGEEIILKNAKIRVGDYSTPGPEKEFSKTFNKTYKP